MIHDWIMYSLIDILFKIKCLKMIFSSHFCPFSLQQCYLYQQAQLKNSESYKLSYFRVKLKRIKFELYTEPDLDQTWPGQ